MNKLILTLLLATPLFSQCVSTGTYNLSSTGQVITIAQPSPPQKKSTYYSTVTVTFSTTTNTTMQLETQQNPVGFTGTSQTVIPVAPIGATCEDLVKFSSLVPAGNVIGQYTIGAGSGFVTIDLTPIVWNPSQNTQALTLRINSTSGTISVNWQWTER